MARRETFDPLKKYTACRDFVYNGTSYKYGQSFDDRSNMRRFRQLYDARYLRMEEWDGPLFSNMPTPALREWLVANGQAGQAHPKATRTRLVERCKRLYGALQQKATQLVVPMAAPEPEPVPAPVAIADSSEVDDAVPAGQVREESGRARLQREVTARDTPERNLFRRERLRRSS